MNTKPLWFCIIVIVTALFALVLASCESDSLVEPATTIVAVQPELAESSSAEETNQSSLLTSDLLHDWLQGIPCSPPCWQGITPGQTLKSQAISILQSNPEILKE